MAEAVTKLPVKNQEKAADVSSTTQAWAPFLSLRREVDRLFDDFGGGFWRSPFRSAFAVEPFWQREMTWAATPAVDVVESEKAYEVTAELPGMDEKNIEVKGPAGSRPAGAGSTPRASPSRRISPPARWPRSLPSCPRTGRAGSRAG